MKIQHMFTKQILLALPLALGLLGAAASSASAASGVASGVLLFYQNQGNFCPLGRDCTGAKYTWLDYQSNEPFRNAKVYVRRASDGAILGQGMTDDAGFFAVAWTDPSVGALTPVLATLDYLGEHADNRFIIANGTGGPITPLQYGFLALPGFTWLNFPTYGTPAAWSPIAQLHDGGNMVWANSLSQSFLMRQRFNNVIVQAFNPTCPTSCAFGDLNTIIIDSIGSSIQPQARMMHELGHVASYLSNPNWTQWDSTRTILAVNYNFNLAGGWNLASAEFESAGWEESIATHFADVGLYYSFADEPYTCLNPSSCPNAASIINVPLEPTPDCTVANSNRITGNHMRYHWDNYDTSIDYFGEIISAPLYDVVNTLNSYPNGTGEGQIDEVWNATRTALDDNDGRSTQDFANRWLARGVNSTLNLATNCGSAGD